MTLAQLAGILPAIVFPTATFLQLWRMIRARSAVGVSIGSWLLFGLANIALYIYVGHYDEWQSICGLLLTALLDFAIVSVAIYHGRRQRAALAAD